MKKLDKTTLNLFYSFMSAFTFLIIYPPLILLIHPYDAMSMAISFILISAPTILLGSYMPKKYKIIYTIVYPILIVILATILGNERIAFAGAYFSLMGVLGINSMIMGDTPAGKSLKIKRGNKVITIKNNELKRLLIAIKVTNKVVVFLGLICILIAVYPQISGIGAMVVKSIQNMIHSSQIIDYTDKLSVAGYIVVGVLLYYSANFSEKLLENDLLEYYGILKSRRRRR